MSTQLIPFAGALASLLLFVLILAVFLIRLGGMFKSLTCPPLPQRCSDRTEYAGNSEAWGRKNIDVLLCSRLYWPPVGRRSLESDLSRSAESPYLPRGIYKIEDHYLKIREWCGFFEYRVYGERNSEIIVYPALRYLERGVPVRRNSIPEKKAFISWMKDREYFDARPYYPGDDPRRINWKMLARHDELFIKEGNSLSPSKKSALIVFDGSGRTEDTDLLLRRLNALCGQLSEAGVQLTLVVPDREPLRSFEKCTPLEKEDLLASVLPVTLKKIDLSREECPGIIYLFSSGKPGDGVLKDLNESFMESRKNLIMPRAVKIDKTDALKGWNIVQT